MLVGAADDVVVVKVDDVGVPLLTATQYAYVSQKPDKQSDETAGFHSRNWAWVMPYSVSTVPQSSPAMKVPISCLLSIGKKRGGGRVKEADGQAATCHWMQLGGWPACVGPGVRRGGRG